jgi:CTP:molybdopterin cytidylyltransferase MocA
VNLCAVLLAAGAGTRFVDADHKLLVALDGKPLWRHALDHMVAAGFEHAAVVTGAVRLDVPGPAVALPNPVWHEGQASSLQVAVDFAGSLNCDGLVVGLADQPAIPPEAWRLVGNADPMWPVACATYDGVRGPNPVRLHKLVWPMLPTEGDHGARELLAGHPDWVLDVACPGSSADIDTVEDLRRWTP